MNRLFKMNYARLGLLGLSLSILLFSCDTLERDAAPEGDDLLLLETDRQIYRGSSIIFDLKDITRTSSEVSFEVSQIPEKGSVDFLRDGLLRYDPNTDFLSGKDMFAVQILSNGNVLDTDMVVVEVVSDSTGLPCFGGALSEFYYLGKNEAISFNPLLNDGYCPESTSNFDLTFEDPMNGTVEKTSEAMLTYKPSLDYMGDDFFVYHVDFIDLDGVSHKSSAIVEFTIGEIQYPTDSACNIWPSRTVTFDKPADESYDIQVVFNEPECVWLPHYLEIVSISNGTAEFLDGQEYLRYFPENPENPENPEKIWFDVVFENGDRFERYIEIVFEDDNGSCPEAYPDEYYFEGLPDSVGMEVTEWIFDPSENDAKCTENYELKLLTEPDFGQLTLIEDGQKLFLEVSEEFAGEQSMEVGYELCDSGECDASEILITVKR